MKKLLMLVAMLAMFAVAPAMAAEGGEGGGKEGGKTPEFEYYNVPPMMLPVITEKGLTQQVSISISLETKYGDKEDVAAYGPRLVDAYIRDLFGAINSGKVMMRGSVLDVEALKTRLTAVTEKVLGEDKEKFHGILLQAVQQRGV